MQNNTSAHRRMRNLISYQNTRVIYCTEHRASSATAVPIGCAVAVYGSTSHTSQHYFTIPQQYPSKNRFNIIIKLRSKNTPNPRLSSRQVRSKSQVSNLSQVRQWPPSSSKPGRAGFHPIPSIQQQYMYSARRGGLTAPFASAQKIPSISPSLVVKIFQNTASPVAFDAPAGTLCVLSISNTCSCHPAEQMGLLNQWSRQ